MGFQKYGEQELWPEGVKGKSCLPRPSVAQAYPGSPEQGRAEGRLLEI